MHLETERLVLREMTEEDFDSLAAILMDAQTMQHYPAPFDAEDVRRWILTNQERYRAFGFGLWSVVLKETGEVIGDCGVTMQNIHGQIKPEIGYHIGRPWQRRGYASEAATACRDYLFACTTFGEAYSYMKYTNRASRGVAIRNGMQLVEEYEDPVNVRTCVYAMTREAWLRRNRAKEAWLVSRGRPGDADKWMALVARLSWNFPGLQTQEALDEHRQTVLRFMGEGRALCVRNGEELVGVLLFSRRHNMICCMAVAPEYRRRGIGGALLRGALGMLDEARDVTVTTFREDDAKGDAPRALYKRFGFEAEALFTENGYPVQRFVRRAKEVRV